MSVPAQPAIDALEAVVVQLQTELATAKAENTTIKAENDSLKQEVAAGVLTDAQAAKLKGIAESIVGKSSGPSGA